MSERLRTGEMPSTSMTRARPSTAIRAVGFSSETLFDPFNQASKKAIVLENKKEDT